MIGTAPAREIPGTMTWIIVGDRPPADIIPWRLSDRARWIEVTAEQAAVLVERFGAKFVTTLDGLRFHFSAPINRGFSVDADCS